MTGFLICLAIYITCAIGWTRFCFEADRGNEMAVIMGVMWPGTVLVALVDYLATGGGPIGWYLKRLKKSSSSNSGDEK